jgi:hypothetical protein
VAACRYLGQGVVLVDSVRVLGRSWNVSWRKLESWAEWKIALAITLGLRIAFSAVAGILSLFLHLNLALIQSNRLTENLAVPGSWYYATLGVWERFDTLWYLHIAQHGYDEPMAMIFYPLYPAAIRTISWLLPPIVAALLVSTVAAFLFLWGLLRLARGNVSARGRFFLMFLVAAWPTSFVLFAGYAESLTLGLIVWAVVLAREGRWWAATLCGVLAGTARPSGVLVAIPLFLLALRSRRLQSAIAVFSPAGWLAYWFWLRWSDHRSVVETYRLYQGMTLVAPWTGAWEALRLIVSHADVLLAFKLAVVVAFAVLSLQRDVRLEDKIFSIAVLLQMLMYTGRPLLGAMRYLLLVYPAFIVLAARADRWSAKRLGFVLAVMNALNLAWMWAFLRWSLVL